MTQATQPVELPTFASATGGDGELITFAVRHLKGRLVVFIPRSFDPTAKNKQGQPSPTFHVDAIVMDGGPIEYGDNLNDGTPTSHRVETPCRMNGVRISQSEIVKELSKQDPRNPLPVIGRIGQGKAAKSGNNFWYMGAETAEERRMVTAWWADTNGGLVNNPVPVEFRPRQVAAQAAPATGGWGQAAAAAPAQVTAPAAAGWGAPVQPATSVVQAAPITNPGGWGTPAQPPAAAIPTIPPGFTPEVWATYPPDVQASIWAGFRAQTSQVGQPAGL